MVLLYNTVSTLPVSYVPPPPSPPALQAAVLVPFLYMSLCCYRSLFTLKIFGAYSLQVITGLHALAGDMFGDTVLHGF